MEMALSKILSLYGQRDYRIYWGPKTFFRKSGASAAGHPSSRVLRRGRIGPAVFLLPAYEAPRLVVFHQVGQME